MTPKQEHNLVDLYQNARELQRKLRSDNKALREELKEQVKTTEKWMGNCLELQEQLAEFKEGPIGAKLCSLIIERGGLREELAEKDEALERISHIVTFVVPNRYYNESFDGATLCELVEKWRKK